jgi:hypothetical protein
VRKSKPTVDPVSGIRLLWQIRPDVSKNDLEPKAADLYNRRDVRGA